MPDNNRGLLARLGQTVTAHRSKSPSGGFDATLGASVLLFQHVLGHDGIDFQLPLVVYLFVASIGTDYNILIISRLREEMRRGRHHARPR